MAQVERYNQEASGGSDRDEIFNLVLTGFWEKLGFEIQLKTDKKVSVSYFLGVDVLAVSVRV